MVELRLIHTADFDMATRQEARELLDAVFGNGMTDDDWEHTLGGLHALALDGDELIGHSALIQRRLLHGGRALRTGYVEAVAVRSDRRGEGLGAAMMDLVERAIGNAYELGALATAVDARGFYARRDWKRWRGKTSVLTPRGIEAKKDELRSVYVLPITAQLDLSAELTCDWRDGSAW